MKSNWRDIVELIGIAAIVASLIFVGIQLKQDRDVALAEATQSSETSYADGNSMIAEYADIWLKGQNGEDLSESDLIVMRRLVDSIYRRARYTAQMRRTLGGPGTAAIRDLAIMLYENPGARRIWEQHTEAEVKYFEIMEPRDTFRRDYRSEVIAELSKLDKSP